MTTYLARAKTQQGIVASNGRADPARGGRHAPEAVMGYLRKRSSTWRWNAYDLRAGSNVVPSAALAVDQHP